jgi:hypothetical protein
MRCIAIIALALGLATAPSFASPYVEEQDGVAMDQPRGERWNERWQGRKHILYDDIEQDAATDGHSANARADCRKVPVRVKRSDGTTTVRRINRCD